LEGERQRWRLACTLVQIRRRGELRDKSIRRRSGIKCDELASEKAGICEPNAIAEGADTFVSNCDT